MSGHPDPAAVLAALPFEAAARTWGDEVYFTAPAANSLEPDARDVVEAGEIVERGGHEELIRQQGRYFRLYTYQARI